MYSYRFYAGGGWLVTVVIALANAVSLYLKYRSDKNRNLFWLFIVNVVTTVLALVFGVGYIGLEVGFISAEQRLITDRISFLMLFFAATLANYVVISRMFVFKAPGWLQRILHGINVVLCFLGMLSIILYLAVSEESIKAASLTAQGYANLAILGYRIISNFAINFALVLHVYRTKRRIMEQVQALPSQPGGHNQPVSTQTTVTAKRLTALNRKVNFVIGLSAVTEIMSLVILMFRASLPPYLAAIYGFQVGLHFSFEMFLQYSIRTFQQITKPTSLHVAVPANRATAAQV